MILYDTGTFLSLLSGLRFPCPKKIPNALFPSPGAKRIIMFAFSTTLDSCNYNVSVLPEGPSSTSHQLSLSSTTLS